MLDINNLREDREEGFKIWFEDWWEAQNLEELIVQTNKEGGTRLSRKFECGITSANLLDRYSDSLFMKSLQAKLPGFKIERSYLTNYTILLVVDWSENDKEAEGWS